MSLPTPLPELREHDGFLVARDDLFLGGTKARVLPLLLAGPEEWVYAGPVQGYAQLALAVSCEQIGARATLFTAKRKEAPGVTRQAQAHGLRVCWVPHGRLSVVNARARSYCELTGAARAPLGLRLPGFDEALSALTSAAAESWGIQPPQLWVTAGTGALASALAAAWPEAELHAVQIGRPPELPPGAVLHVAPEPFAQPARGPLPPFPSAEFYDAKAWRFLAAQAAPGSLFWNVAG